MLLQGYCHLKPFSPVSDEEGSKLVSSLEEHQLLHAMHLLVHKLPFNQKHVLH